MTSRVKMLWHNNVTISFSGADGVGKSTQIKLLKQHFENNGITYRILYARARNIKICQRMFARINSKPMKLNRALYRVVNYIINTYVFSILKNSKKNNQILLMDRALIDSVVDESMDLKTELKEPKIFWEWKKEQEIRIYMNAEIGNIEKRIRKRGEPFDYVYTKTQLCLYQRLFELNKDQYICIDANRDEQSIFKDILILLAACRL